MPPIKKKRYRKPRRAKLPQDPITLDVFELADDGRGVAKHEGKIVFVDGGLPEETVVCEYRNRRKDYDEVQVLEVITPSKDRIPPFFNAFGISGAVPLQHLHPQKQIEFKAEQLKKNLQRIAGITDYKELLPLTGPTENYRYKARLGVRYVAAKKRVLVGFRERYSNFIVDMDRAPILEEGIDRLITPLAKLIGELSLYNQIPQIEVAVGYYQGKPLRGLSFRVLERPNDKDIKKLKQFEEVNNVILYLQPGNEATTYALSEKGASDQALAYSLLKDQLTLYFKPYHFTQVNPFMNEKMVNQALSLLELKGNEKVLDLFCGLGNFTLALATKAKEVVGVEGDKSLTDWAEKNAKWNQLSNTTFFSADLTKDQNMAPWMQQNYDVVLIDPPRSGALEMIPYLNQLNPEKILYVSCHPATLARDIGALTQDGAYQLVSAGVIDMFPHTAHVESMAFLKKTN